MTHQRRSVRFGLGVGGFGVLTNALTVFLLFTLPQRFLGEATASAFLETWFGPIGTVGGILTYYGTPILAAICGFYLVYTERATVGSVFVGFVVGGVAFGAGVTLLGWGVTSELYRQSTLEYVGQFARLAGRVLAIGIVGALVGRGVRNRR